MELLAERTLTPSNSGVVVERDEDGKFVKGHTKIGGRTAEVMNFKTKWLLFIDKIAKKNNITPDEVDDLMLTVAYKQMQSGDYRYWKDIQDRVYGQATANLSIGGVLNMRFSKEFEKDADTTQETK